MSALRREIAGVGAAERIRTGYEVAILGAPNAGKSTLLNALAGRDAAITSEIAGTTRDVIEVRMDIGGLPVTVLDTAGLRETEDQIEAVGVARALQRAQEADLRVFLTVDNTPLLLEPSSDDIVLKGKGDLIGSPVGSVSGQTGAGVDALIEELQMKLIAESQLAGAATHERHRVAMERAVGSIEVFLGLLEDGPDRYDIAAAELRIGISALEALVGRIGVENLLDEIFLSFCIGK
jgi:tRNA modification GTPase